MLHAWLMLAQIIKFCPCVVVLTVLCILATGMHGVMYHSVMYHSNLPLLWTRSECERVHCIFCVCVCVCVGAEIPVLS